VYRFPAGRNTRQRRLLYKADFASSLNRSTSVFGFRHLLVVNSPYAWLQLNVTAHDRYNVAGR